MNIILKEKEIYRVAAGIDEYTYTSDTLARKRIARIFGSFSRILRGRKSIDKTEKSIERNRLYDFVKDNVVSELLTQQIKILKSQTAFDSWHEKQIYRLIRTCPITWDSGERLTIGMAQKIVNLVCKDLWALGYINSKKSLYLHIVLDRAIIDFLKRYILVVPSWTLVDSYTEYMEYQKLFKTISLNSMVLENIIWYTYAKKPVEKKANLKKKSS